MSTRDAVFGDGRRDEERAQRRCVDLNAVALDHVHHALDIDVHEGGEFVGQEAGDAIEPVGVAESPRDAGTMREYDLSDPAAFRDLGKSPLGGDFLYCGVQDGLLLQGGTPCCQENRHLPSWQAGGRWATSGSMATENREHGQVTILGNLVFVGDDHGVGSALAPHSAAPDGTAPRVVAVSPRDGAADQAVTSRIGIGFSDSILLESVTGRHPASAR